MTESTIPTVELRIYQSFSEVRTLVQSDADHLSLTFPSTTWSAIDDTSITLLGLPYTSKTTVARESWLTSFEGQQVWLQRQGASEEVTLIRAEDLVVQNTAGAFFHVQEGDLLLPAAPPPRSHQGVVTLTFTLPAAGEGVLTYVTEALTWSAHYRLDIDSDGHGLLRGDATLHNRNGLPFEPAVVTLVAGDVRPARQRPPRRRMHGLIALQRDFGWEDEDEHTPEIAGLYRYQLKHPPRLAGAANITVPFDDVPLKVTTLTNVLSRAMGFAGGTKGVFQRRYRVVTERPLLSAKVTVRDQGYLVGQQNVTETAAGEEIDFTLGRDPNVTYRRDVSLLGGETLLEGEESRIEDERRAVKTYQVTYQIRNASTREIKYEVEEETDHLKIESVRGPVERTPDAVTVRGGLQPSEVATVVFEVVVDESRR